MCLKAHFAYLIVLITCVGRTHTQSIEYSKYSFQKQFLPCKRAYGGCIIFDVLGVTNICIQIN